MPDIHPSLAVALIFAAWLIVLAFVHADRQTWTELWAALRSIPALRREALAARRHPNHPHLDEDTETWHG